LFGNQEQVLQLEVHENKMEANVEIRARFRMPKGYELTDQQLQQLMPELERAVCGLIWKRIGLGAEIWRSSDFDLYVIDDPAHPDK